MEYLSLIDREVIEQSQVRPSAHILVQLYDHVLHVSPPPNEEQRLGKLLTRVIGHSAVQDVFTCLLCEGEERLLRGRVCIIVLSYYDNSVSRKDQQVIRRVHHDQCFRVVTAY